MGAMAEVEPEDVDARLEQRADLVGGRARRTQRGDDLSAPLAPQVDLLA